MPTAGGAATLPVHELEPRACDLPDIAIGGFDDLGPLTAATTPHRHRFYELAHVTGGGGWHVVDAAPMVVQPPQVGVVVPGQVHFWKQACALQGRLVLFSEHLLSRRDDRDVLETVAARPWIRLDDEQSARVARLLDLMAGEIARQEPGCGSVVRAYLHVLVVHLHRHLQRATVSSAVATNPPLRASGHAALVRGLRELVRSTNGALPVRAYAAQLGVSVGALRESSRQIAGLSPGQIAREVRVREAKRLLASTDLTVVQVARELGFADPAYFCRFFRREQGSAPGAYREDSRRTE